MHIESYRKLGKNGQWHSYQVARIHLGHGRRASLHLPKGMTMEEFMLEDPERCGNFLALQKKPVSKPVGIPPALASAVYGPIFSKAMKAVFEQMGYSVKGSTLKRHKRNFFDNPEAVALRYEMLDPDSKALVGSVHGLRLLEDKARSMMKKASSKHISGFSFEHAMATLIHK